MYTFRDELPANCPKPLPGFKVLDDGSALAAADDMYDREPWHSEGCTVRDDLKQAVIGGRAYCAYNPETDERMWAAALDSPEYQTRAMAFELEQIEMAAKMREQVAGLVGADPDSVTVDFNEIDVGTGKIAMISASISRGDGSALDGENELFQAILDVINEDDD